MKELPSITASAYASNLVDLNSPLGVWTPPSQKAMDLFLGNPHLGNPHLDKLLQRPAAQPATTPEKPQVTTRIVRVFIADTNDSLPLGKRVIYKSEEQHTDLTDQELFFETNPAALLAEHNAYRTTVVDRTTLNTQSVRNLEPVRIRDLKMVVVTVASF